MDSKDNTQREDDKEQFETRLNINKYGDGFAFIFLDKENNKNRIDSTFVSIKNNKLNQALYGDIVNIVINGKTDRDELSGEVVSIIRRNKQLYVGELIKEKNQYIVIPSDHRIHVDFIIKDNNLNSQDDKKAELGDKVAVNISE
ncbi:MAG: hypothetical protein QM532_02115 [Cyanobium sp. MAG06]|nr:hypothetical protein [Cyanobium sp. MAG06]